MQYAAEQYGPLCSRARGREFLLDLTGTACRPGSAPDMRSRMRLPSCAPSCCFDRPVWLPRIPTSCPNTAKAPCVCTLPARREAWNGPSRARFRPAAAAGAARRHAGAAEAHLRGPIARPRSLTHLTSCRPVLPVGPLSTSYLFSYLCVFVFRSGRSSRSGRGTKSS